MNFKAGQVNGWLKQLKKGEIKPDHMVDGEFGGYTLLQAVIKSELSVDAKLEKIKEFIKLGCDVDEYSSSMTAISMAAMGSEFNHDYKPLVKFMLDHHEKGTSSDIKILINAAKSFTKGMFEMAIRHKNIDVNAKTTKRHILHYLAGVEGYNNEVSSIFKYTDAIPNPINRYGLSPLTIAINNIDDSMILALLSHNDSKIIGKLAQPKIVVQYGIVKRYDGDFWGDFPTMINYAVEIGKDNLLPELVADIFIF